MATSNKRSNTKKDKIAEPITAETRAEKINKLVEEQAQIIDPQEEKFLESSVAEIEAQPVVEEFVEVPAEELVEEPVAEVPTAMVVEPKEMNFDFQETYFIGGGDPNVETKIDTLPVTDCTDPDCPCNNEVEPCVCEKPEEPKCDMTLSVEEPYIPLMITPAPKFQLGQQIQKLAEVDIEPTVCAPFTTPPVKKTFAQMTATEMNIYKKTGIIPFV